ncbi:heavy-metal-associated domain-containing protein [Kitasatospora sp. NPDC048407]|uniref:heavy-metal-associated domain-containing protein n=1 Tax=Kitasatospora sp. NPDC048407 TaxID=3364051 RepID=UPI0037222ACA
MSCCSSDGTCSTTATIAAPAAVTTVFAVSGMTCGHCEKTVGKAIGALEGVEAVQVDVKNGLVTVGSVAELDDETVRAAVDEAGYELTGRA